MLRFVSNVNMAEAVKMFSRCDIDLSGAEQTEEESLASTVDSEEEDMRLEGGDTVLNK